MVTNIKGDTVSANKFQSFISTYLDFELFHYSHKEALSYQKYEESAGDSIMTLACYVKTGFIYRVKEDDLTAIASSLSVAFKELVVSEFSKSDIYKRTGYLNGTTLAQIESESFVLTAFKILLSRAFENNFQKLFLILMELIPNEVKHTTYKTILQEYLQSKKKALPKYQTAPANNDLVNTLFYTYFHIDNKEFSGFGENKKSAEKSAAYSACIHYKIVPENTKLRAYKFEILDLYANKNQYRNSKISNVFSIPSDRNIMQAFIPPRVKRAKGHNGESHRRLATIGSVYLHHIKNQTVLDACKKKGGLEGSRIDQLKYNLSNDSLLSIFKSGLISKNDLLFVDKGDYASVSYQVDCAQALFCLELLEGLYNSPTYTHIGQSDASNWIVRVLNNTLREEVKIQKSITSILAERCQSLGFTFRFIKNSYSWGAEIVNIKTKKKHEVFYNHGSSTPLRKDALLSLSKMMLKCLDRLEGYYFVEPKSETSKKSQTELLGYFFHNMTDNFKSYQEISELALEAKANNSDYNSCSKDELIEVWQSGSLDIYGRANVLFLIHKNMNVVSVKASVMDYCFLPAVFEPFFDVKSFSITDVFSSKDTSSVSSINDYSSDIKNTDKAVSSFKANAESPHHRKNSKITNHVDSSQKDSNEKESNDSLNDYKKLYEDMSLESLESIWLNRTFEFDYIEEAAIVLSLIRFYRGIDVIAVDYRDLLFADMITELDLSSIHEEGKTASLDIVDVEKEVITKSVSVITSKKQISLKSTVKADSFVPDNKDERDFVNVKVASRVGQSSFRNKLIEKWKCCNITGCTTISALDAAHIAPYRGEKDNDVRNGLLLRADIHRLFDAYLIGIDPDSLTIHISSKIDDPIYTQYEGKKILTGNNKEVSLAAIQYHWLYYTNDID